MAEQQQYNPSKYEEELASLLVARKKARKLKKKKARDTLTNRIIRLQASWFITSPNYLTSAALGCHVAHYDAQWIVEVDEFRFSDYGLNEGDIVPDFSVDPSDQMLTVLNPTHNQRCFFLSTPHAASMLDGTPLQSGEYRTQEGQILPITTFILVLSKMSTMEVCRLEFSTPDTISISSDIKELHHNAQELTSAAKQTFSFPLKGGPYICSQGCHGCFTHFFAGTCHAVDLECAVGTPVIAVDDGEIVEIEDNNDVSGIHVDNLFKWNSVMLKTTSGNFVEYVHIKKGSCTVNVGDKVERGQQICSSGDVGFCPSPHLHFQVHDSSDKNAPTVKFQFQSSVDEETTFLPVAGDYCDETGIITTR